LYSSSELGFRTRRSSFFFKTISPRRRHVRRIPAPAAPFQAIFFLVWIQASPSFPLQRQPLEASSPADYTGGFSQAFWIQPPLCHSVQRAFLLRRPPPFILPAMFFGVFFHPPSPTEVPALSSFFLSAPFAHGITFTVSLGLFSSFRRW